MAGPPRCGLFKPAGVPCSSLGEVVLTLDEMEAMRLADLEGMYQEQAAEEMHISRPTFGRVIESARRKVAQALMLGQALRIEGGPVEVMTMRRFQCYQCQHVWEVPPGTGRPQVCPRCQDINIHRAAEDRGGPPEAGRGWAHGGRGRCRRRGGRGAVGQAGTPADTAGTAGKGEPV